MIDLFPHNEEAYQAAVSLMKETGKAAIIHPTGTGKSFIGLKLAEDHPDKVICWLSPSEYIFRTQIENLEATGAAAPKNIKFYTYAKLMNMSEEELTQIQPDFIVYDEFHRCGAGRWSTNVRKLFELYPDASVLGLSATNIRYLDNQRDMAEELFDGNIAAQMTLGEAIVRGILKAPKYVVSVFSFQKDLDQLQLRVSCTKNKAVRERAERDLEALRRSVEHAEGLEKIFRKHITEKSGKYILFVPNAEAMQSVKEQCASWFSEIDAKPHIYTAYFDEPETSTEFANFKNDHSSHLKILMAINMLNEGIHVEDIAGVILFRPTISPILYKQQIGRALCANKEKEPLILDIVANVYNLFSIDSVKDEIADSVRFFRESDEEEKIVVDDFTIYDEVKDCRELFEQLEDTLSSSWDEMYLRLVAFKERFGHVKVPANYKTADRLALGNWCVCQRRIRRGKSKGRLTEERIQKLNSLGFSWEPMEDAWRKGYESAVRYEKKHGNLAVPNKYITKDGFRLGSWIRTNRLAFANQTLPEERIQLLRKIHMIWDVNEYRWQYHYNLCKAYYQSHGETVPTDYTAPDGSQPGVWLSHVIRRHINQTAGYTPLREDQIKQLCDIGVVFERKVDQMWNDSCYAAEQYYKLHHNLDVPSSYVSPEGVRLLCWLDYQRQTYAGLTHSKMTPERQARLDKMNFDWTLREKKPDTWFRCFESCRQYKAEHNGKNPPQKYIDEDGMRIGSWLSNQKRKYRAKAMPKEQEKLLRSIGVDFEDPNKTLWINGYDHAAEYYRLHQHLSVPVLYKASDGYPLGEWLRTQVKFQRVGKLSEERKALLDKLGMPWKPKQVTACNMISLDLLRELDARHSNVAEAR